jgi:acyl-coenzyme A thioesterase PaaI-like protein
VTEQQPFDTAFDAGLHHEPDEELRARMGAAMRRLGHQVVGHDAAPELLADAITTTNALADRFAPGAPRSRAYGTANYDWGTPIPDGAQILTHADRPISGIASPWGCEVDARRNGDEVLAHFTLGAAHEGAPGRCHGGIVAALFDDVLGMLLQVHHIRAFTGELTVRYHAGTPLHRPLEMRGRVARLEGRKLHLEGELHDGETLIATCKALFITVESVLSGG